VSGKVLVAGIGNIFLGDDGFGVEVARRMLQREMPPGVCVTDFGIRGFDVACSLIEPWDLIVMADASARGGQPGTVYVVEIDPNSLDIEAQVMNAHGLHPASAIQLARALGKITARLVLVACEPADLGGTEGRMDLSPPVEGAVESAIRTIEQIAGEFIQSANLRQGVHA
jgi:hydrogenase maturation protease